MFKIQIQISSCEQSGSLKLMKKRKSFERLGEVTLVSALCRGLLVLIGTLFVYKDEMWCEEQAHSTGSALPLLH